MEFFFDSRDECKGFWKKCIEHHAFYRCHRVKKLPRHKTRVVSRGSSFRYCGLFCITLFTKRQHFRLVQFESILQTTNLILTINMNYAFHKIENIVGKGEDAGYQHFLLFPQCFLPFPKQISVFQSHLFLSSANAFNLD